MTLEDFAADPAAVIARVEGGEDVLLTLDGLPRIRLTAASRPGLIELGFLAQPGEKVDFDLVAPVLDPDWEEEWEREVDEMYGLPGAETGAVAVGQLPSVAAP